MQSILANTTASPGFDSGRLADFLRTTLGGWSGDLVVRPIHGGQSNPTFLLSAGTNRYVLRTKPSGQLLPSAHAIEREYRVMSALAGTDVPVARFSRVRFQESESRARPRSLHAAQRLSNHWYYRLRSGRFPLSRALAAVGRLKGRPAI